MSDVLGAAVNVATISSLAFRVSALTDTAAQKVNKRQNRAADRIPFEFGIQTSGFEDSVGESTVPGSLYCRAMKHKENYGKIE
jgi:hypothetical protein